MIYGLHYDTEFISSISVKISQELQGAFVQERNESFEKRIGHDSLTGSRGGIIAEELSDARVILGFSSKHFHPPLPCSFPSQRDRTTWQMQDQLNLGHVPRRF